MPYESHNIRKLTHTGGPGTNSGILKPLKLHQSTLHFGNLQSLSICTREVKCIAACSVYDMLSKILLGLLHKIANGVSLS